MKARSNYAYNMLTYYQRARMSRTLEFHYIQSACIISSVPDGVIVMLIKKKHVIVCPGSIILFTSLKSEASLRFTIYGTFSIGCVL